MASPETSISNMSYLLITNSDACSTFINVLGNSGMVSLLHAIMYLL